MRIKSSPKQGPQPLNRLAIGLFLMMSMVACSTPDPEADIKNYLDTRISDTSRAQALQSLSVVLEKQIRDLSTDLADYDRELRVMNMTYETTAADLQALLDHAEHRRSQHQEVILETFLEMRAIATKSEWKKLSKLQIDWVVSSARSASPL